MSRPRLSKAQRLANRIERTRNKEYLRIRRLLCDLRDWEVKLHGGGLIVSTIDVTLAVMRRT